MRRYGFSTGALAHGDFRSALVALADSDCDAVELSALREDEVAALIAAVPTLDLSRFQAISFHIPSRLCRMSEARLIELIDQLPHGWLIIAHPDLPLSDPGWQDLGGRLCLENMDQRKPIGRDLREMQQVFRRFPDATFCCDLGHARQVDPTMTVAAELLTEFRDRVRQIHLSEVDDRSKHRPLSRTAVAGIHRIAQLVPSCPVILEAEIPRSAIHMEVRRAQVAVGDVAANDAENRMFRPYYHESAVA